MAEKTQDNKPDATLMARIEVLEAEKQQRDKMEIEELRRNIKLLKEALDVAS